MRVRPRLPTLLYFGLWGIYFSYFWARVFHVDAAGNLFAGHAKIWADWALHFALGNAMLERQLLPDSSPLLLDAPFSYPIAADLLSALLMRAGMDMLPAFVLPALACSLLLVAALYVFLRTLFGTASVAALGGSLFLLAGGLGFVEFFRDLADAPAPLAVLLDPPRSYTDLPGSPVVLISIIDSMILPQRAFTLGFPLALFALAAIHATLAAAPGAVDWRSARLRLTLAGLALGSLPVVHPHSLLAAFVILACWMPATLLRDPGGPTWQRLRPWLLIAAVTTLVAVPLILAHTAAGVSGDFFRWFPGWYARELGIAWPAFWIQNWGPLPILALGGLWLRLSALDTARRRAAEAFYLAPFLALFGLVNLFLFAPWPWDNTKLLVWAAIGLAGLAAHLCVQIWRSAAAWVGERPDPASRLAALAARLAVLGGVAVCTAAAGIDAWRSLRVDRQRILMYSAEDLWLGAWAREYTHPRSIWLTGDRHTHWVSNLAGRQPVMAYRGWLWSTGYDYRAVEADVARMFRRADPALLARYRVDYVVIGADERQTWGADEARFAARFPVALRSATETVYDLRAPAASGGRDSVGASAGR